MWPNNLLEHEGNSILLHIEHNLFWSYQNFPANLLEKAKYSIYPVPDSVVTFFCSMHLTRSTGRIHTFFCKTLQDMKPQMKLFVHLLTITSSFVFCGFSLLFRRKIEKTIDYKLEILFLQKKNALIGINKFSSFHQF